MIYNKLGPIESAVAAPLSGAIRQNGGACRSRRPAAVAVREMTKLPSERSQVIVNLPATSASKTDLMLPVNRRLLLYRAIAGATLVAAAIAGRRAFAADATVTIDNFVFLPTPLTVAPGTTVTWENRDDIPHAIYCPALNLHSHALDTNDTFQHRFDQMGTFDYICSIHPNMRGRIVVSG